VLGRWHAVDGAGAIAAAVKGFGMALLFAGFAICLWNLFAEGPRDPAEGIPGIAWPADGVNR
jgi:hypothetical protein